MVAISPSLHSRVSLLTSPYSSPIVIAFRGGGEEGGRRGARRRRGEEARKDRKEGGRVGREGEKGGGEEGGREGRRGGGREEGRERGKVDREGGKAGSTEGGERGKGGREEGRKGRSMYVLEHHVKTKGKSENKQTECTNKYQLLYPTSTAIEQRILSLNKI